MTNISNQMDAKITPSSLVGNLPLDDNKQSTEKVSVMLYILTAIMSKLDCSKSCLDDNKNDQLKEIIEQSLLSVNGIDGRQKLIAYLKSTLDSSNKEVLAFLGGLEATLKSYQSQIDDAVNKYKTQLQKVKDDEDATKNESWNMSDIGYDDSDYYLSHKPGSTLYDLQKQKDAIIEHIDTLLNQPNHTSAELDDLKKSLESLMQIVQQQLDADFCYNIIKNVNDKIVTPMQEEAKRDQMLISYTQSWTFQIFAQVLSIGQYFEGPQNQDELTFANRGEVLLGTLKDKTDMSSCESKERLRVDDTKLQQVKQARQDYTDGEKEIETLATIVAQGMVKA